MLSLLTNYLTTTIKYIIVAVVSFLLGYGCYAYFHKPLSTTNSESKVESKSKDTEVKRTLSQLKRSSETQIQTW